MNSPISGTVDCLLTRARALVEAVAFDDHGDAVGGEFRGGNGGLLSNNTIQAADALRTELLVWGSRVGVDHGVDVTAMTGTKRQIDPKDQLAVEAAAFEVYREAFLANGTNPTLDNAAALVAAWNGFAVAAGVQGLVRTKRGVAG